MHHLNGSNYLVHVLNSSMKFSSASNLMSYNIFFIDKILYPAMSILTMF